MDTPENSHASRKSYKPDVYAQLLGQLTELMEQVPKLRPDRDNWDIEGDWAATGTIYFIDKQYQLLFEKLRHFDCRTIKLVNMDRPACRITFYRKHRYTLIKNKDLPIQKKKDEIINHINAVEQKAMTLASKLLQQTQERQALKRKEINQLTQEANRWQDILDHIDEYELAISNYDKQHMYVTLNYKYKAPDGTYLNEAEHMLNTQRDKVGNITQVRYNLIFVDPMEILREHPYQNREVEGYLNTFPIKSQGQAMALYVRKRPEGDLFTKEPANQPYDADK